MKIFDLSRQLYLLLWKNFVLRRRHILRIVFEFIWPLFLFLILMWVRTRGLVSFESQCFYAERALPSSGVLPFIRTYACELNYSCSTTPRYNPPLDIQLTNLSLETLNILNQNDTIQSLGQIVYFFESLLKHNQTKLTQLDQIMRLVNNLNPTTMGYNPGIDLITKMNFENIIQLIKQPSLFGIFYSTLLNNVTLMQNTFNSFQILQNKFNQIFSQFTFSDFEKSICGDSPFSIFTILNSFNRNEYLTRISDLVQEELQDNLYDEIKGKARETLSNSTQNQQLAQLTAFIESMNRLKLVPFNRCPSRLPGYSSTIYQNSTTRSCFCQTGYRLIRSISRVTRIAFDQIRSMLLGKILYTPNTPAYVELVKKINTTFSNVDNMGQLIGNIAYLLENVLNDLNTDSIDTLSQQINQLIASFPNLNFSFDIKPLINQTKLLVEILKFIRNSIECVELNKFMSYSNEYEAVEAGLNLIDRSAFWSLIVFDNPEEVDPVTNTTKLPKILKYKIRMNAYHVHDTTFTQDRFYTYSRTDCIVCNLYFLFGFIYLQDLTEKAIIETKTNKSQNYGIIGQMHPYPCYVNDKFMNVLSRTLPLFMVLAWIYTVAMMVKDIVYEKEKRLKEFMRVMGLSNGIHWTSWFITSFVTMFFIAIFLCIIIKYGKVTQFSDLSALLVFFCCFTIATITQCFLISVFFNQANLAAVVAAIIYFLLYLPYTVLFNYSDVILPWQKFLASLSSTVAFGYGCEILASFEVQRKGLQWSNFYESPYIGKDDFSMNTICLILLLDAIIYMILAWYIETVAPGEYGIPMKWYFPIQSSYWFGESHIITKKVEKITSFIKAKVKKPFSGIFGRFLSNSQENGIQQEDKKDDTVEESIENIDIFEEVGIEIEKLHKVYSRGNNHALKGLSIKFYKNEITAFLGHNGAGKSTTMHILTGLYSSTSGTARINGLDIKISMDKIRKSLGFVPQHNVLFPGLTVKEHLWFYARLKGLDSKSTKIEMEKMLDDTGLRPKKDDLSKSLSGGMQRKLSVAIAFVGGSKTVILDEPSAGVDPSGRRSIWDLLFKFRLDRTIVISTHHMDEADVLGDRIAIISNGKLIAHGTSYFLKHKYGRGYYVTFAKKQLSNEEFKAFNENNDSNSDKSFSSDSGMSSNSIFPVNEIQTDQYNKESNNETKILETLKSNQDKEIHRFFTSIVDDAVLVENLGVEMTYSISNKPDYTKSYEKSFHQLEQNMDRLGIESIGISDTKLEEIFIKLAKEPKKNKFQKKDLEFFGINFTKIKDKVKDTIFGCCKKKQTKVLTGEQLEEYSKYTKLRVDSKFKLLWRQLYALLVKRVHRVKRNKKGFFAEIVLPVIFVCLALLVAILVPSPRQRPALELHPWYYNSPNQVFFSKSSSYDYDRPIYNPSQSQIDLGINPNLNQIQSNINEINNITNTFFKVFGTRCMSGHKIKVTDQGGNVVKLNANDKVLDCNDFDYILNKNYSMPSQSFVNELIQTNFSYTKRTLECDCSRKGFPDCPVCAGGDYNYRNIFTLKTKDVLYDLTGRDINDFLVKTEFNEQFFRKRFGGIEFLKSSSVASQINKNFTKLLDTMSNFLNNFNSSLNMSLLKPFFNMNLNNSNPFITSNNVKIWYNLKGYDSNVAYLNVLNNAFLRSKINEINEENNYSNYLNPAEHGIVAFNHPMNFTKAQFLEQLEKRIVIDLFVAICMIFALSFIPASFLVFLLEERETNTKQLQFVSGVKPYVYWTSNFIWDLLNYVVPVLLCIIVFFAFDVKSYTSKENFPYLICLMLLYGWGCIPLMYPLNYLFNLPSTAFVVSSSMNVFFGVVTTLTVSIMEQLGDEEPDLLEISKILKPIFIVIFPHFCLGQGFLEMSFLYNLAQAQAVLGIQASYSPFKFDSGGRNLLALAFHGIAYFALNLLIQYQFFIRFKPTNDLEKLKLPPQTDIDDDVANERNRILNNEKNDDFIKLVNLTKIYKKFKKFKRKKHVAVNAVSLGIKKGECFGLIGVNGAGKTTTFKMITGEIPITAGDVFLNNYSVSKQINKVHENIGYCPQIDAIMPLLTAREHLIFFARLRGIPEKYVDRVCEWALNRVGLTVFANRISRDFSGGNKRKLSTAIALVGDPSVVCLDEPTSGMDAKARRLLWNDILSLIKENRIVILTSHSMEECEALCTRLVIMVNGQFKCLGSPQHLKRKFGSGFKLVFRLNDEKEKEKLFDFMNTKFPTALIQESHKNLFEYILPFRSNNLSEIFGKIEKCRNELNLKDYSVNQTTLDQIFVGFAKGQSEDPFSNDTNNDSDLEAQKLRNLFKDNDTNGIKKTTETIEKTDLNNNDSIKNTENFESEFNLQNDENDLKNKENVDPSDI